jgi:hypothetical protein
MMIEKRAFVARWYPIDWHQWRHLVISRRSFVGVLSSQVQGMQSKFLDRSQDMLQARQNGGFDRMKKVVESNIDFDSISPDEGMGGDDEMAQGGESAGGLSDGTMPGSGGDGMGQGGMPGGGMEGGM